MPEIDDCSTPLGVEILSDVARRFFETRRELERAIGLFETLAAQLRIKRSEIDRLAGAVNYLLLRGRAVRPFYHALSVEDPGPLLGASAAMDRPLPKTPWYMGRATGYSRMVITLYTDLQASCEGYQRGLSRGSSGESEEIEAQPSYELLVVLGREINDRIARAAMDSSPADTLQYARQFMPAGMLPQNGGAAPMPGYAQRLEENLAFRPLVFDRTGILPLPLLPPPSRVNARIATFCKGLYRRERHRIGRLLEAAPRPGAAQP